MDKSFDQEEALRMLAGKADLFAELLEMFFDERNKMLLKIQQAIETNDPNALRLAAHAMRGPLNTLGARTAGNVCHRIEQMGTNKDLSEARQVYQNLADEVASFEEQAKQYLRTTSVRTN